MGVICDFCGEQRSVVYCKSDVACLCLSCDRNVHSANSLSQHHSRTPLCDGCNAQPARVRCIEEKLSFCQSCDWNRHGGLDTAAEHKRQGGPSAADLSRIWSFVLDFSSGDCKIEEGMALASIDENSVSNCWGPSSSNHVELTMPHKPSHMEPADKAKFWMDSSPLPLLNSVAFSVDQQGEIMDLVMPKLSCDGMKDLGIFEDAELFKDFNMGDLDLRFENYEKLFGNSENSQVPFEDDDADKMNWGKNISAADSNGQNDAILEKDSHHSRSGFLVSLLLQRQIMGQSETHFLLLH